MKLDRATWPEIQLGDALLTCARYAGLAPDVVRPPSAEAWVFARGKDARGRNQRIRIGEWIVDGALHMGFEAQPVSAAFAELEDLLARSAPALLHLSGARCRFLAIVGRKGHSLRVVAPDGELRLVPIAEIVAAVATPLATQLDCDIASTLDAAGFEGERRERARRALASELLGSTEIGRCYLLRERVGGLTRARLGEPSVRTELSLHLIAYGLGLAATLSAFAVIAAQSLSDALNRGPLWLGALLIGCAVPLRLLAEWHAGRGAIGMAHRLRERLLLGIFRLTPEEVRGDGAGAHLSRVMEADSFQTLAVNGAVSAAGALVEMIAAAAVVVQGAGGSVLGALWVIYVGVSAFSLVRLHRARRTWARARLALTSQNTERVLGYATRLVQEPADAWHDAEDAELCTYFEASKRADSARSLVRLVHSRGWLLLGVVGLVPALLGHASPSATAIGLGGILLGQRAVSQLGAAAAALADAFIAWRTVEPLYRAADRASVCASPEFTAPLSTEDVPLSAELVEGKDVCFGYAPQSPPVIANAAVVIRAGLILFAGNTDDVLKGGDGFDTEDGGLGSNTCHNVEVPISC